VGEDQGVLLSLFIVDAFQKGLLTFYDFLTCFRPFIFR